jgi:hypothetical protein
LNKLQDEADKKVSELKDSQGLLNWGWEEYFTELVFYRNFLYGKPYKCFIGYIKLLRFNFITKNQRKQNEFSHSYHLKSLV